MTKEEGRATREDERAPCHRKTQKTDQQQAHPTALTGRVVSAARLEDLPSVLGTAELCRVLRTTRYRVRALVAAGEQHGDEGDGLRGAHCSAPSMSFLYRRARSRTQPIG